MGKCTRKGKISGDVAVMEVSQISIGVRTRAKTLALCAVAGAPSPSVEYLQLRSRRLEKLPPASSVGSPKISERLSGDDACAISDECDETGSWREDGGSEGIIRNRRVMAEEWRSSVNERGGGRIPSAGEVEEFFAEAEQHWQQQLKLLSQKYNFDFVNGAPHHHGRYKWTSIRS